jgi:hypothetical protein
MARATNTNPRRHIRKRWWMAILLAGLLLLMRTPKHSTAKLEFRPAGMPAAIVQNLAASQSLTGHTFVAAGDGDSTLVTSTAALAPFLDVVPSQDGTELFISAGGVGKLGGTVYANIGIGSGCDKGSYTMIFSDTIGTYVATATGLTPNRNASAPLSITTTLGLDSGAVDFNRAYVPASTSRDIVSEDRNLQLKLVSTDTFPSEAYVVVVPSYAPPGPLPLGHRLLGSAYSVRASGAMLIADRPMSLRLYYSETTLAGADPHTLAIFAWDAYHERWDNLGGTLFSTQQYVSVATRRFTTYALMATLTWRDEFDDLSGLDFARFNHVTWGGTPENRTLVLVSTKTDGSAVSNPITPTTGFAAWGNLAFSRTIDPPTTTLTVDVLGLDGSTVLADVASGTDLADLVDPVQHPSLRLRVNMSSTVVGKTPALERWQLAWQVEEYKVYLPIVLKPD